MQRLTNVKNADRLKLLKHLEEDHICHMFNTINNYPKDWVIQH